MNKSLEDILFEASSLCNVKIHEYKELPVSSLSFSQELLDSCKTNVCGNYNKSWSCPPASPTMEEQQNKILSYKNILVFTTKHDLEDSFDYEGITKGMELHSILTICLGDLIKGSFPIYGAGSCPVCNDQSGKNNCSFPAPCKFPEKMIYSLEAAGINVIELSKSAGIKYNNGPNTVTYFSMALW